MIPKQISFKQGKEREIFIKVNFFNLRLRNENITINYEIKKSKMYQISFIN